MLLACGFIMLTLNQDHTLPAVAGWMRFMDGPTGVNVQSCSSNDQWCIVNVQEGQASNETSTLRRYESHEWMHEATRVTHWERRDGIERSSSLKGKHNTTVFSCLLLLCVSNECNFWLKLGGSGPKCLLCSKFSQKILSFP